MLSDRQTDRQSGSIPNDPLCQVKDTYKMYTCLKIKLKQYRFSPFFFDQKEFSELKRKIEVTILPLLQKHAVQNKK